MNGRNLSRADPAGKARDTAAAGRAIDLRDLDSQTLGFARFTNMSFAVIRTGGKQYRVTPGATVTIEKLAAEPGENVEFNEVLVRADGDNTTVGQPLIEGCLLYTSPSPRDKRQSRMPSSA